ncbi:hypothetical protein ACS0TY_022094 [Phlomoides rotata]
MVCPNFFFIPPTLCSASASVVQLLHTFFPRGKLNRFCACFTGSVLNTMEEMTEVESEVVNVDDIEEGEKESCLVGRLLTVKNWNSSDLIKAIEKAWKPKHGMCSREWGESKLILFRFEDVMDRDWVLKNQPWHFMGSLFAIKKFVGGNEQDSSSSVNVIVEHASFWARLYDVPFSCMNERSLSLLIRQIGILESVDISGEDLIGKFIRFKVFLNITKPLLRGITIQVKGKHLWLPLKYEWLPIYCFSCGTIGHDHNNCESFNRNLKYSSLKVRASSSERRKKVEQKDTPTTLPHDIVENILSRLPAKYLIRYKSVCKMWKATISDPRFAETHLQQYKKSSFRSLVAWEQDYFDGDYEGLYVAEIQNGRFQFVAAIQHSRKCRWRPGFLCHYDGLYLTSFYTLDEGKVSYLLWNPSCRAYKEIWCPLSIDDENTKRKLYGIYYNPLVKDYKVLIGDEEHYAVFSCRYNKWSEVKDMKDFSYSNKAFCGSGVCHNGSLYWLNHIQREGFMDDFEIICFDWKFEMFKKVPMPNFKEKPKRLYLNSSGDFLCLLLDCNKGIYEKEKSLWKRVNDGENGSWMEFKMEFELEFGPGNWINPICWVNESEIMVDDNGYSRYYYFLYDSSKNTFVEIRKSRAGKNYCPVIYRETLFLQ